MRCSVKPINTGFNVYRNGLRRLNESYASNSMSSVGAMPQATASADVSMTEDHEYAEGALEEKWVSYQRQLGSIFQDIFNGSLESASETLLSVTSWLLSQVADLGMYNTVVVFSRAKMANGKINGTNHLT